MTLAYYIAKLTSSWDAVRVWWRRLWRRLGSEGGRFVTDLEVLLLALLSAIAITAAGLLVASLSNTYAHDPEVRCGAFAMAALSLNILVDMTSVAGVIFLQQQVCRRLLWWSPCVMWFFRLIFVAGGFFACWMVINLTGHLIELLPSRLPASGDASLCWKLFLFSDVSPPLPWEPSRIFKPDLP